MDRTPGRHLGNILGKRGCEPVQHWLSATTEHLCRSVGYDGNSPFHGSQYGELTDEKLNIFCDLTSPLNSDQVVAYAHNIPSPLALTKQLIVADAHKDDVGAEQ